MSEILTATEKIEIKKLSEKEKKKAVFVLEKSKQKISQIRLKEIKNKLKELEENKKLEQELGIFNEKEYNKQKEILQKYIKENIETNQLNEVLDKIEQVNKNLKKFLLLQKIAIIYKGYLQNIYNNIQTKWLSNKDEKYLKQIKIIEKELIRIQYFKLNKGENINKYIKRIFKSEEKLGSGSWGNPFIFIGKDGKLISLKNPSKITKQVNQDYKNIIQMIQNFSGNKKEIKQIETNIYKLFRKNDHYDETYNIYNSGEAISSSIINDVLENKEINKNEKIKKLKKILKNLTGKNIQNISKQEFKKLIIKENIISKEKINKIYNQIEKIITDKDKIKKQMKQKIKEELKLKYEVGIEEGKIKKLKNEELKNNLERISKNIVKTNFNNFLNIALENIIKKGLSEEILNTENIQTNDKLVKMYYNINGIGNYTADKTINKIVNGTEIFVEFLLTMYVGGILTGIVRGASIEKIIKYGNKLGLTEKTILTYEGMYETLNPIEKVKTLKLLYKQDVIQLAKMLGIDMSLLVVEGTTFGLTLQGVKNVKYGKNIEDLTNIDINTIARIILFLGIIKALSINIGKEKIQNKYLKEGINLILDTTTLIGTDTTVKIILNEKLPKTEKQITEYLFKELEEIVPLLIGIKAINTGQTIIINLQEMKIKTGEKKYNFEQAKRYAKEKNGIKERENIDYGVNTNLYEFKNLTLEDILLGKDKKTLSTKFKDLLNNNHTEQELINLGKNKVEQIMKEKLLELGIKTEELSFKQIGQIGEHIREIKKDYEQAIKERIKMEQGEIKKLSDKYGNPEIVARLLDKLIRRSLKDSELNKLGYSKIKGTQKNYENTRGFTFLNKTNDQ